jgi:NTE family protein
VKCFAQLGALQAFERAGLRVRAVAATSAGGLVGAGFAAGHGVPRLIEELAATQLSARFRRARRGEALLDARAAHHVIHTLVGLRTFAELDVPLALTTVDLDSGARHVLHAGAVAPALRAAIAIPGLFPPETLHGKRLIDGGAIDPVPVRAARRLAPGLPVVAVVLTPRPAGTARHPAAARLDGLPAARLFRRLRFVRAFEVFVRAADISHRALLESRLTLDQPEIIIRPNVAHLDLFGRVDALAVVAEGERAAAAVLRDELDAMREVLRGGACEDGRDDRWDDARHTAWARPSAAARRKRATASATGTPAL